MKSYQTSEEYVQYLSDAYKRIVEQKELKTYKAESYQTSVLCNLATKRYNKSQIAFNSKNNFNIKKLNLINIQNNNIINKTYKDLSKDNYSKIYESFNDIDKKLHEKYKENNSECH